MSTLSQEQQMTSNVILLSMKLSMGYKTMETLQTLCLLKAPASDFNKAGTLNVIRKLKKNEEHKDLIERLFAKIEKLERAERKRPASGGSDKDQSTKRQKTEDIGDFLVSKRTAPVKYTGSKTSGGAMACGKSSDDKENRDAQPRKKIDASEMDEKLKKFMERRKPVAVRRTTMVLDKDPMMERALKNRNSGSGRMNKYA